MKVNAGVGELTEGDVALAQPVVGLREFLVDSEGGLAVAPGLGKARQLQLGYGPVGVVGWLGTLSICERNEKSGFCSCWRQNSFLNQ